MFSNKIKAQDGIEAIKQVYERSLEEHKLDFICTSKNYDRVLGGWYEGDYAVKLSKSGAVVREILAGEGKHCIESSTEGDVIIANSWVALVSFDPQTPGVCVIEDENLVQGFADRFEALWQK
jgi:hypothetical protein